MAEAEAGDGSRGLRQVVGGARWRGRESGWVVVGGAWGGWCG